MTCQIEECNPKEKEEPSQENKVRFEKTNNTQRPRVPKQPSPNTVVLEDVYDDKLIEKENYYSPDEISETVYMDGWKTPMYIFEEGYDDPNSQENVA
jgi:hypothetical protein